MPFADEGVGVRAFHPGSQSALLVPGVLPEEGKAASAVRTKWFSNIHNFEVLPPIGTNEYASSFAIALFSDGIRGHTSGHFIR